MSLNYKQQIVICGEGGEGVYLQFATPEANPCFTLLKNQRFIVETGTP